jgi:hypothetical protein
MSPRADGPGSRPNRAVIRTRSRENEQAMRTSKIMALAGTLMLGGLTGIGPFRPVAAQDVPSSAKTTRGGLLAKTEHHQFEVFFYPTGLRVFPQSVHGTPVAVSKLTGTATFTLPGAPKPFVYTLKGASAAGGREPESLDLSIDLSKVPAAGSKVAFEIDGLDAPAGGHVSFTVPFELVPTVAEPRPSPSQGYAPAAPSPRYIYAQGYYGQGYYQQYEQAAPVARPPSYSTYTVPSYSGSLSGGSRPFRDWSTGRDIPLAKPWMKPY